AHGLVGWLGSGLLITQKARGAPDCASLHPGYGLTRSVRHSLIERGDGNHRGGSWRPALGWRAGEVHRPGARERRKTLHGGVARAFGPGVGEDVRGRQVFGAPVRAVMPRPAEVGDSASDP